MTIIEFYDKVSLENIAGALLCKADRIILVGDNRSRMEKSKKLYDSILRNRGINTEISYLSINRNNLQNIVEVLTHTISSGEEYIFDLTGGDDLYLVAIGIIMNRFEGRIQCHRFNFHNNVLYDCDADGNVCSTAPFMISAEENIAMYGGILVYDEEQVLHTFKWEFNEDFNGDVEFLWDMCRRSVGLWNLLTGMLGSMCETIRLKENLNFCANDDVISSTLSKTDFDLGDFNKFLRELENHGVISSLNTDVGTSFVFKNKQIRKCITMPGQILELIIAKRMKELNDKDGNPLYHQVIVGAVIDWDRTDEENKYRTINEIDILAMRGAIPIFISCKNGAFDENELYKLSTVADKFGDKYAKKVLVSTKLDKFGLKSDYLRARMADMGIKCIDNITTISDDNLNNMLKALWLN